MHTIRTNWLAISIYAIVVIGMAFQFANNRFDFAPKFAISAGLAIFVVAGTLAYLMIRDIALHPDVT